MRTKRILFWDDTVSNMNCGRSFGGIAVQLNFWMQVFSANGWEIHALTNEDSYDDKITHYHHINHFHKAELIWEWANIYKIVRRIRPSIILFRGAKRLLYPLSRIGKRFGAKVIMQGASDVNFEIDKANVGNTINRRLYVAGLHRVDYIVCQNKYQTDTLKKNFNRDSLIISNIWVENKIQQNPNISSAEIVWVGNFRKLKRPEWLYEAARALPEIKFAIAGGPVSHEFYNQMAQEAESIRNLSFLGQISIDNSNALIGNAQLLVCTSEYEGFPNTFLQAWSANVPVISTVDPNKIIENYYLGLIINSPNDLINAITKLLADRNLYISMQQSIGNYFSAHHSAQKCFDKLIDYIHEI